MGTPGIKLDVSKEWLDEHYINQKLNSVQCAELLQCHVNTVRRWLRKYGIHIRVALKGELNPMHGRTGKEHHNYNSVERECPVCGKAFKIPMYDIARRFTCSWECRNKRWKLEGLQSGENNPHWFGGIDYRRGGNWEKARNKARKRDGYRCVSCGVSELELGQQLDVHHIRPYRLYEDSLEANEIANLVSLCKSCHTATERALID